MKRWLADHSLRAVLRNSSYLGLAKLLAAPLGLAALACAGRGLTPGAFGLLMVIHSYANSAGALSKFQTWQLIIRYGCPALEQDDSATASDAVRFAFGLDITSGIVGMIGAIALLPLIADRIGLTGYTLSLALFYCTLVPTMTAATPVGVLRMFDRFDLIAVQQLISPLLRAVGAGLTLGLHQGIVGFIITWYVADIVGDIVTWLFAARELRRREMSQALRPRLFRAVGRLPGAWNFAWTTNIGHSVYAAWGPVSNIIVAAVLGPASAGLFKIASTLVDSTSKPADLISRGFYPEIMRLDPASKAPWRLGLRAGAIAGIIALVMLLVIVAGGKPIIALIFGRKYLESYDLLRLMTWSLVLSMATFPTESLLYMVGRQRAALAAQLLATMSYLAGLVLLSRYTGLTGAGLATVFGSVVMATLMLIPTIGSYRNRRKYRLRNPVATLSA